MKETYSTAVTGRKGYNPEIIMYYADVSGTELVCIEEVTRDTEGTLHKWAQTISGSNYSDQWPNYDHYIVYGAWEETTYSG
jgi:hypothetical protein